MLRNVGIIAIIVVTFIEALSSIGRTTSLGAFVNYIDKSGFASMTTSSLAYSTGNIIAILILPAVGYFYDRSRPSSFIFIFCSIFGISFFCLSGLFNQLHSFSKVFGILIVLFSCIRLSIYAFSLTGRSLVSSLFEKRRRTTVTAISCGIISIFAAICPYIVYNVSKSFSWQSIWLFTSALFLIIGLTVFMFLKTLRPQKSICHKNNSTNNLLFLKSKKFWLFNAILSLHAMQAVGISFHIVPIANELGINPSFLLKALIPISALTLITNFLAGRFLEKIGIIKLFTMFLINNIIMLFALLNVKHISFYYIFIIFSAVDWGINHILLYVTWPTCFGINNVGNINAWAIALTGIGSALGPYVFTLLKIIHSYHFALSVIILILASMIFVMRKHKSI